MRGAAATSKHPDRGEHRAKRHGKRRRKALLVAAIGLAVLLTPLVLSEVWFRWKTFDSLGPWQLGGAVREGVEDEYCQYDPLLGWRGKPNFEGLHYRANLPPTPLSLNSKGWRDRERSVRLADGRKRILLLGDSFGMGLGVPFEQAVACLLEKETRAEVVNLSMNGYSTDQELLVLEKEGLTYQPDVVVLLFYWNDVPNNVFPVTFMGYTKPCFTLDAQGNLVLQYRPGHHGAATPGFRHSLARWFRNHSELYRRLWVRGRMAAVRAGKAPPVSPFDYAGPKAGRIALSPDAQGMDRNAIVILGKLLRKIDEHSRSIGAKTLIVVIPMADQVRRLAADTDRVDYDLLPPGAMMRAFARQTGIPTLMLLPALREAERLKPTSFPKEFHWTPAGHRAAAKAIADELRRRKWMQRNDER